MDKNVYQALFRCPINTQDLSWLCRVEAYSRWIGRNREGIERSENHDRPWRQVAPFQREEITGAVEVSSIGQTRIKALVDTLSAKAFLTPVGRSNTT